MWAARAEAGAAPEQLRVGAKPVLLVAVVYAVLLLCALWRAAWDPSHFIAAGDRWTDAARTASAIHVLPDSPGYDGQFYYRLAVQPWTAVVTDHGVTLDSPPFRQQRIGYPALAWAISLGHSAWLPLILPLLNFLALVGIASLGMRLAASYGQAPWLGALLAFHPGFVVTLLRDLTEAVAAFFVVAGILCWRKQRNLGAGLAFAAAVACRETSLLVPAGLALAWGYELLRARTPAWLRAFALIGPSLAVYGAVQLAMWKNWGLPGFLGGTHALNWPFWGIAEMAQRLSTYSPALQTGNVAGLALCIALMAFGLRVLPNSAAEPGLKAAFLLSATLMLCLGIVVWESPLGFLRAGTELYLLAVLIGIAQFNKPHLRYVLCGALCLTWLGLALALTLDLR